MFEVLATLKNTTSCTVFLAGIAPWPLQHILSVRMDNNLELSMVITVSEWTLLCQRTHTHIVLLWSLHKEILLVLLSNKHDIGPQNSFITFSHNKFQQQALCLFIQQVHVQVRCAAHVCVCVCVCVCTCGMLGTAIYQCMIDSVLLEAVGVKWATVSSVFKAKVNIAYFSLHVL